MTHKALSKLVDNQSRIDVNLLRDFYLMIVKRTIIENHINAPKILRLPYALRQITTETLRLSSQKQTK